FRLFSGQELQACFAREFETEELRGLDIFTNRFRPDGSWNPAALDADGRFAAELARLEDIYGSEPAFIDHATHLLLGARRRWRAANEGCPGPGWAGPGSRATASLGSGEPSARRRQRPCRGAIGTEPRPTRRPGGTRGPPRNTGDSAHDIEPACGRR